ncbi:MAG TPA: ACP S-malonyltransferase [Candidatus Polarisedimenticolia bacterium]|nr:ACP S-malonyltransferase [Candidatus Polarisedimenticolia bacterium]
MSASTPAFLFPGQGSQTVGMGRSLSESFAEARDAYREADEALGFSISKLCFEGPEQDLRLTELTQPAILVTSIACERVLRSHGVKPSWVAGHSLGEYSALISAGSLSLSDAVRLVNLRGKFMQEAVPVGQGAMAAILGLAAAQVEDLCREAAQGETLSAANFNSSEQTVVAGTARAGARAVEAAASRGAKRAILLPVSAPFHCALMAPARERLRPHLGAARFRDLECPLIGNVDARAVRSGDAARENLLRQITAPVRWDASVREMAGLGATHFVEVGPGRVLSGLVRRALPGVRISNVEDPASLEKTLLALQESA